VTPLRVPLQTGAAALLYAQLGGVCLVLGGACVPLFFVGDTVIGLIGFVLVGSLIAVGLACWLQGVRTRPSDAVLDADGFAIAGGTTRGRWRWADVPASAIGVTPRGFTELTLARPGQAPQLLAAVTIVRRSGAFGGDAADRAVAGERDSLAAIRDLLASWPRPGDTRAKPAAAVASALLSCSACGAPLRVVDADDVECPACRARTPVPAKLRDHLRAARALRAQSAASARAVANLVRQPGHAASGFWIAASAGVLAPIVPLFVTAASLRFAGHPALYHLAALIIPALVALSIPFVVLGLRATANRGALRGIVLGLRARPATAPGAPPRCRACSADLDAGATDLARCAYCGADNVVLADLATDLVDSRLADVDLTALLRQRGDTGMRALFAATWRVAAVAAIAAVMQL
jgi:DNA-directed RNA polymerase subunit RPC12/RpoP